MSFERTCERRHAGRAPGGASLRVAGLRRTRNGSGRREEPWPRTGQGTRRRIRRFFDVLGWGLLLAVALTSSSSGQAVPEPGSIRFVQEAVAVSEQDGVATIWVVREPAADPLPATVEFSVIADTAEVGTDYEEVRGVLGFYTGARELLTIDIPIIDDDAGEGTERLLVVLHDPAGASLAGSATLTLEILDDDQVPPGGALAFASASVQHLETGGALTVQVERREGSQGAVSALCVNVGGTAEPEADYRFTPTTLTWADGESGTRAVTVEIRDDGTTEGWESVVLGFRDVTGATLYSPSQSTVLIDDDEYVYVPPKPFAEQQSGMLGGNIGPSCFIGALR